MSKKKPRARFDLLRKKKQGPIRFRRWSNWRKKQKVLTSLSIEQNHRCAYCSKPTWSEIFDETGPPNSMATLEHFIPLSLGGTNDLDNLIMACHQCNQNRGTKPALLFYYTIQGKLRGGWMRLERAKDRLRSNSGILHVGNDALDHLLTELERLHLCDTFTPPVGEQRWNNGKPIWWNAELRYVENLPNTRKPWYVPWNRMRRDLRRAQ